MKYIIILLALSMYGCMPSKITSSWTSPESGMKSYKKIVVIGIIPNEDSSMRFQMEKHLAGDLKELGYKALSFSEEFDRNEFSPGMNQDSAKMKILNKGFDAVITISLINKKSEQFYVQEKYNIPRADGNNFWGYYQEVMNTVNKKGYYVTETKYFWESNMWDLDRAVMIYTSKTTSFEMGTAEKLAHKYGKLIVEDLQKKFIVTQKDKYTLTISLSFL